jgi:hypothetical protein
MRLPLTGLIAATALLAGVAGCGLPEVLPLAGGTTSGPSPYGPWYEQHWATNAVLLAATDQPGSGSKADDVAAFEEQPATFDEQPAADGASPKVHVAVDTNPAPAPQAADFDNSSPYQFPASSFAPKPAVTEQPPAETPPAAPAPAQQVPPPGGGAIRY